MSKSPVPATFADVAKKPKRKRTRKVRPDEVSPGHEMHQGTAEGFSGETHRFVPGVCDQYHSDVDKACRSFGEEAMIPVSSTDRRYQQHANLAARAGQAGSMHVPVEGEDPSSVKSVLGTPPVNPLARAMQYMDAVSKGAAEWAADSAVPQPAAGTGPALGHSDLQQQPNFTTVLSRLRTVRGNNLEWGFSAQEVGPAGGFAAMGTAQVDSFDAAMNAGSYRGMGVVDHNPLRPDYHQSRGSATSPNGSHSLSSPESTAVANKMSPLDIMKSTQRIIG